MKTLLITLILAAASTGYSAEHHVSVQGADTNLGSASNPLRTIQRAADIAQPGDTITVHAGVYRERIAPPRGGESGARRIIYQAAPTAGQHGLVTAYWCKGWIIENNEICYSRCAGIALGKYSDKWEGTRGTAEGYYLTIDDAWKKGGWIKDRIGGHIVRNNHIHHCGQVGIVGSLGCAFSRIEGNDIHDCNLQGIFAEIIADRIDGPSKCPHI